MSRTLAGALLAFGASLLLASPAPASIPRSVGSEFQDPTLDENTTRELKRAARHIMERMEVYKARLERIDSVISFYRAQGDARKVQQLQRIREREINSFQGLLGEYRRLLGDRDFERLGSVLRYLNQKWGPESPQRDTPARVAARTPLRQPTQKPQVPAPRSTPDINRSIDRQLRIERSRASQRMQLAQRIEQARQQELRRAAAQQQRYGMPPSGGARPGTQRPPTRRGVRPQPTVPDRRGAVRPQVPPRRRP